MAKYQIDQEARKGDICCFSKFVRLPKPGLMGAVINHDTLFRVLEVPEEGSGSELIRLEFVNPPLPRHVDKKWYEYAFMYIPLTPKGAITKRLTVKPSTKPDVED